MQYWFNSYQKYLTSWPLVYQWHLGYFSCITGYWQVLKIEDGPPWQVFSPSCTQELGHLNLDPFSTACLFKCLQCISACAVLFLYPFISTRTKLLPYPNSLQLRFEISSDFENTTKRLLESQEPARRFS